MSHKSDFITVFRSAETDAETDAAEMRERLSQAGIQSVVLGDDTPGVIEGSWEVRVAPADRERAEAIVAAPSPEPEDESDVSERALTHDLDFVPVFRNQTPDAEMEAISIQSLLEANGIPCVLIGSAQFPSLPFEVRVPKSRLEEAKSLLEEIKQSAADSAE
jgi:Putative prokaryotic signal transducing protein